MVQRFNELRKLSHTMKFRKHLPLSGLTALAAAALANMPAFAATVANPVNNDIFLGVRAAGGVGGSSTLLVNLGQYSTFASQQTNNDPYTTIALGGLGDLGADLVATFGANWNTRSDVQWGIFGRSSSGLVITYGSREQTTPGTVGEAWPIQDQTARTATSSAIGSVLNSTGGYRNSTATLNSAFATVQANSGQASSYAFQTGTAGTTDFGSLSGWGTIEGNFGNGVSGTALDLYKFYATDGTGLTDSVTSPGFFTFSNSGTLSFTSIPEPSAALMGAAGVFMLLTNRRRQPSKR